MEKTNCNKLSDFKTQLSVYLATALPPPLGIDTTPSAPRAIKSAWESEFSPTTDLSIFTNSLRKTSPSSSLSSLSLSLSFSCLVLYRVIALSSSNSSSSSSASALADVLEESVVWCGVRCCSAVWCGVVWCYVL